MRLRAVGPEVPDLEDGLGQGTGIIAWVQHVDVVALVEKLLGLHLLVRGVKRDSTGLGRTRPFCRRRGHANRQTHRFDRGLAVLERDDPPPGVMLR